MTCKKLGTLSIILFLVLLLMVGTALSGCSKGAAPTTTTTTTKPTTPAVTYDWKLSTLQPPSTTLGQAAVLFCNLVNLYTDGRARVTPFLSSSLYGPVPGFQAAKLGNIDFVVDPLYASAGDERFAILQPPMGFGLDLRVQWEIVGYPDSLMFVPLSNWMRDDHKLKLLGTGSIDTPRFIGSTKILSGLKDLAGLKLRIPETPHWVDFYKKLGVAVTPMPYAETYSALQTGVIDAGDGPFYGHIGGKWIEVEKCILEGDYGAVVTSFFYSPLTLWSAAPKDIQDAIWRAAQEACQWDWGSTSYSEFVARRTIVKNYSQVKIVQMPTADCAKMKQVGVQVYEEMSAKLGAEATSLIKQAIALTAPK